MNPCLKTVNPALVRRRSAMPHIATQHPGYVYQRLQTLMLALMLCFCYAYLLGAPAYAQRFNVTNLVSDGSLPAVQIDPNLVNAWGISYSPTGPFWVSDNGAGVTTLYKGDGSKLPLVVTIPSPTPGGTSAPTGQVFNGGTGFVVTNGSASAPALFIFATEDGTISGWSPKVDPTNAILAANRSDQGAVYKGLAKVGTFFGDFLYATDFHNNNIDVFNAAYQYVGSFTDPYLPKGYAPFGIAELHGYLYVTFAKQKAPDNHDDQAGPGNGYVDIFSPYGFLLRRLVSRRQLNSPWGLAIAPPTFGRLAGTLLVGNFGDGRIHAYNPFTGRYRATLKTAANKPIVIDGLWGLIPGNGGLAGDPGTIYFSAGPNGESDGLFGSIAPLPIDSDGDTDGD